MDFCEIRTIYFKCLNTIVKTCLELFVFNRSKRRLLKGKFCRWFLKGYIKDIESSSVELSPADSNKKYRIWQYWDKGEENAPDLVKVCLKSVEKFNQEGIERVVLNENTIGDYVQIPDYIYKLKDKGIISPAHFADILRTYLLYEHGGLWIDATVYLTGPLPDFIRQSELFVLQNDRNLDPDGLNMTNYFMSSRGNSVIIAKMKKFLEKYWLENHFVINYFFYMHAFTLFTASSLENKKEWSEIHPFSYITVQEMEQELLDKYSKERMEVLCKNSPIHKLSYKKKVIAKKKKFNLDNTVLEYILRN